ncbi:MAG: hypothetical protein ABIM59_07740, partial [candidate division WOR-3 bacterium]
SLKLESFANDVEISGKYAYVAIGKDGVRVVDITNPRDLKVVGHWTGPGAAIGVRVQGDKLTIGAASGGVRLMDLRQERELAHYTPPRYTRDFVFEVILCGNYLLAASRSGLIVYEYTPQN